MTPFMHIASIFATSPYPHIHHGTSKVSRTRYYSFKATITKRQAQQEFTGRRRSMEIISR